MIAASNSPSMMVRSNSSESRAGRTVTGPKCWLSARVTRSRSWGLSSMSSSRIGGNASFAASGTGSDKGNGPSSDYSPASRWRDSSNSPEGRALFSGGPFCNQQSSRPIGEQLPGRAKLDPEPASLPGRRIHPDLAAHPFYTLPHERKSYAGAGIFLLAVEALEDLEDPGVLRRIDADAIVLHPEAHATRIATLGADLHLGRCPLGHELERIGNEIGQHLDQGRLVGHDGHLGPHGQLELGRLGFDRALQERQRLIDRGSYLELASRQLSSGETAELEDVSDHAVHPDGDLLDGPDVAGAGLPESL